MGRFRHMSVVAVMVILSILITSGAASAAPSSSMKAAAAAQTFTVSSTTGWQQTGLYLTAGQQFKVEYVSGCWTVDSRNFPCVGPQGYSSQEDAKIYQDCKFDGNNNYGVLYGDVGAVANGAFAIGAGGSFTATAPGSHVVGAGSSGYLYLRINDSDACLGDNAGSVTMRLSVLPPPPTCPPTPQPQIYWSQTAGPQGTHFSLTGNGWYANNTVTIHLPPRGIFHVSGNSWSTDSSGGWKLKITIGKSAPLRTYRLTFTQTACSHLQVTGHFKVTMTRVQYGNLASAIYQLIPAADEIGKLAGGKRWASSVTGKALNLISKAQTVVSIAFAGLDVPAVHNDLNALIKDLKKAHNNKKDPAVQRDVKQLRADTNRLRDALINIVPGLEFIFPPSVS